MELKSASSSECVGFMFGERKKLAHLQEPLGLEPEYVVKNCMIALV